MVYFRDRLFVVSSGTNSIEMFDPRTFRYLGKHWQHPKTTISVDQVHLNSLCEANGELWASVFGPKVKDKWSLTSGGSLINTADGSTRYRIYHPHSVTFFAGDFYYCESWTGLVFRNNKPIKTIEGAYVRGLDVNSNYIVIGANSGRIRSKSRGTLNDPWDVGKYNFISGILVLNKRRRNELYFDLSKYSRETEEYTREIYATKFIEDIILNDLGNIISSHKLEPSPTIEKNYVASLLMGENQKLRIALEKATEERHKLEEIIRRGQQARRELTAQLEYLQGKTVLDRIYKGIKRLLL